MKRLLLLSSITLCLHAEIFDDVADQKILECAHSSEFANMTINYSFAGYEYPLVIIHNPNKEALWNERLEDPTDSAFIMMANVPNKLRLHILNLSEDFSLNDDAEIDLSGNSSLWNYLTLQPIKYGTSIDTFNAEIQEAFHSTEFVNKVFYYYLDNTPYRVRILHDPRSLAHKATKNYQLGWDNKAITITWNYRYGIITDRRAPQELIDHLSKFTDASYWDWYINFKVHNGTNVTYEKVQYYYSYTETTTYSLDTWFNYTEELK